ELREPYRETAGESQLRLGQFVQATIHGKLFDAVFRIPSHALYTGDEVFLFKNNMLQRQSVTVLNREGDFVVISHGLEPGELLVTTPLGSVVSGTRARLAGKAKRHQ
ncbi:MAG: efflux transporter periplasmic adaptor subunit, partial [Thermodesulfobacteriota bacterium]